ncbi:hypothetical protein FRC03_000305 [Tulasnella sp. 419]|nr:hypothetical protein FRC03_000305 [Tulasnella sp. 419]
MPELPEVERAAKLIRDVAQGRTIEQVETKEDTIVYSGTTHEEFATELTGRKVTDCQRYGKLFYITLNGNGKCPVLHFGMTGMIQVQGQEPTWYRSQPRDKSDAWPPNHMKFILHLSALDDSPAVQIAFRDPRRLARIRLCQDPLKEPPISELGFDPILSMPELEDFKHLVLKRGCPIKALLLDQSFSAGVGNWVADEILFQAQVHPEQKANSLDDDQLAQIYQKMIDICTKAVEVNADSSQFPNSWLFRHRWEKGRKGKKGTKNPLILPSGEEAKIKWLTVGGRTSAVVEQVQINASGATTKSKKRRSTKATKGYDSDDEDKDEEQSTNSSDEEEIRPRKRARGSRK